MTILLKNKGWKPFQPGPTTSFCPLVGLIVYAVGQASHPDKTNPFTGFLGLYRNSTSEQVRQKD